MTAFVLDASIALSWCFADEATPATDALLDRLLTRRLQHLRSGGLRLPTRWPWQSVGAD